MYIYMLYLSLDDFRWTNPCFKLQVIGLSWMCFRVGDPPKGRVFRFFHLDMSVWGELTISTMFFFQGKWCELVVG